LTRLGCLAIICGLRISSKKPKEVMGTPACSLLTKKATQTKGEKMKGLSRVLIAIVVLCVIPVFASAGGRSDAYRGIQAALGGQDSGNVICAFGDSIFGFGTQVPTDDDQCLGVEFDGTYFYITGGGGTTHQDPNKVHVFDRNGSLVGTVNQPTAAGWGWRDIAYDGNHLYSSDGPNVDEWYISGLPGSPALNSVGSFSGPCNPNRALAYDPATDHFWTANWASNIYEFTRAGTVIGNWPNSRSAYGMAWDDVSPDGPWLWVFSQDGSPLLLVSKYDPINHSYTDVTFYASLEAGAMAGGAAFSDQWDPSLGVLFCAIQGNLDRVVGIEIATLHVWPPDTAKIDAILHLQRARDQVPKPEQAKISEAINFVQRSLNSGWWIDGWHLNESKEVMLALGESADAGSRGNLALSMPGFIAYPVPREARRYGEYVFENEMYAARIIRALLKNTWYKPEALENIRTAAGSMIYADSILAQVKIAQAESAGADPGEIRQAHYAMVLAEMLKRSGRQYYDAIVSYYGSAWLHAVKAQELGDLGPQMAWAGIEVPVFALGMSYPNPSYSGSVIAYSIGQPSNVGLNIYDISGRLIRTLVDEAELPGSYTVEWDGRDANGSRIPSGTYVYRLSAGLFTASQRVVMLK
jgi:hypothetical protein